MHHITQGYWQEMKLVRNEVSEKGQRLDQAVMRKWEIWNDFRQGSDKT